MVSFSNPLLGALAAFFSLVQADSHGRIAVLKGDNINTANPDTDRIGCVDVTGRLTVSDCAIFTKRSAYPYTTFSDAGDCHFRDVSQPANTDSKYGKTDHSWHCYNTTAEATDGLYIVDGTRYPFLWHGDTNAMYDVPYLPVQGEQVPIWEFHWGSQQMGITPGHTQAMFLWQEI